MVSTDAFCTVTVVYNICIHDFIFPLSCTYMVKINYKCTLNILKYVAEEYLLISYINITLKTFSQ